MSKGDRWMRGEVRNVVKMVVRECKKGKKQQSRLEEWKWSGESRGRE